ncbi:hypothetical protein ACXC9Q_12280 [Kribbella sp. CWNU-51]
MPNHVKRREPAAAGSIPAVLKMFESEVRFYREIAPVVGVRVPACYQAEENADGTLLVLEDLSAWTPGAEPAVQPERWSEAVDAYGTGQGLVEVMPSTMVQGYLTMADYPDGSEVAAAWNARLEAASALLAAGRL